MKINKSYGLFLAIILMAFAILAISMTPLNCPTFYNKIDQLNQQITSNEEAFNILNNRFRSLTNQIEFRKITVKNVEIEAWIIDDKVAIDKLGNIYQRGICA